MTDWRVGSLEEALEAALELKANGHHDLVQGPKSRLPTRTADVPQTRPR